MLFFFTPSAVFTLQTLRQSANKKREKKKSLEALTEKGEMMLPSSLLLCLSAGDLAVINFPSKGIHKPVLFERY